MKIMNILRCLGVLLALQWGAVGAVQAQANLEANTPAIAQIKHSMQARFGQLQPLLASGALGIGRTGDLQLHDASRLPLPQRQAAMNLMAADNADRAALYREIARANGKPEWEGEIRATFAQRWRERAAAGWWVQNDQGQWQQK